MRRALSRAAVAFVLAASGAATGLCAPAGDAALQAAFADPAPAPIEGPLLQADLWAAYRIHYIFPEGRLGDDGNEGVSHTEGQGYAMLLSVFADDRPTFDRLWGWTKRELLTRPDGLGSWRWRASDTPHVKDRNNASDGDLLIAWALAEAAQRWGEPAYRAAAHKLAVAIGTTATRQTASGRVVLPGVEGFGAGEMPDGPVVNLSYWVFPAFDALAAVAPEVDWAGLRISGQRLLAAARFGPARLPSDWISLEGSSPAPAQSFPKRFGYDSIRIPLYLAWSATINRATLEPFVESWNGDDRPSVVDVTSGLAVEPFYDLGYQAVVSLARCAVAGVRFPDALRTMKLERYYSSTLQLLSIVAVRQRYPQCW